MENPVSVLVCDTKNKAALEAKVMVALGFDVVAVGPVDSLSVRAFTGDVGNGVALFDSGEIFAVFCYNKTD